MGKEEILFRNRVKFTKGRYPYKYSAKITYAKNGKKKTKTVNFGHQDYEQYMDSVPIELGGQKWKHKNHLDKERRRRYRSRHMGIMSKDGTRSYKKIFTPSWFSYYFLW